MRRRVLILAVCGLVLVVAGCGGETTQPAPQTVEGSLPEEATGDRAAGKAVFGSAGCASCHALADADASGTVGPNLDQTKPDLALVADRVTNGKGAMPAFGGQLTPQQIADVAAYVADATPG